MATVIKLVVLCALLLPVGGDTTTAGFGSALLRVELTGLPANAAGQVTVNGPGGAYTITASDERLVTPGMYTLTIHPVHVGATTYYPADDRQEVTVDPRPRITTTAAYRVAVPDTTKILDPADPAIIAVRANLIDVAANSRLAERIHPGDHLVSGEGPRVPHLLVRQVASVSRSGNRVVVDTIPASFDEALPVGLVRFDTIDGLKVIRPAAYWRR